jgi:regulator of nucleoside diphosphate kinase
MSTNIFITDEDLRELREMVDQAQSHESEEATNLIKLDGELRRAQIVPPEDVPRDVVTMNSKVVLYDLDTDEREIFTLVYPWHADAENNRVSVLAPIGTALIGARVGDVVQWPVPAGTLRFRVEELVFQPESEGMLAR